MSEVPTIGDVLVSLRLNWIASEGGSEQSASFDTNDPENETGELSVVRFYDHSHDDDPPEQWAVHLNGDPMPGMTEMSAVEAKMAAEKQLGESFPNYGPTPEPELELDPIPFE